MCGFIPSQKMSLDEFSHDLSAAGFSVKAIYGNMMGADYSKDGKEMCFIAQKGGHSNDGI